MLVKGQVKKVSCQLTVSVAPCEKAYKVHICTIGIGSKLKYRGHAVLHKHFRLRTLRLQNKGRVYDILASFSGIPNCPLKYSISVVNRKIMLTSENLCKNSEK